jgi:hypothetical protein
MGKRAKRLHTLQNHRRPKCRWTTTLLIRRYLSTTMPWREQQPERISEFSMVVICSFLTRVYEVTSSRSRISNRLTAERLRNGNGNGNGSGNVPLTRNGDTRRICTVRSIQTPSLTVGGIITPSHSTNYKYKLPPNALRNPHHRFKITGE